MDRAQIRQDIVEQGFCVLPRFLTTDEVERLRLTLARFFERNGRIYNLGKSQPNAAMVCPDIGFLISSPKVVEAFRAATGDDNPVFTGHCDIHQDMISDWHKDTGHGHGYFAEDCFTDGCNVIKMGVYLQDHVDGNGLSVVPGSHLADDLGNDNAVAIPSQAGDVILFDVRITHRGRPGDGVEKSLQKASRIGARIGKSLPAALRPSGEPASILALKTGYDRLRGIASRHSVFFTFGADNRFTAQFAERNMARQQRQWADRSNAYPGTLRPDLEGQGVHVYPRQID
ncbi:phytanoyl-CoA dioxygenase family protein [Croceicoccus mobilis]|uniref:Phytanoyl-CoA dioxygenase n=1 Tax=Croceicoccus mobilis TaxID=1703339 RepID=A0A916YT49_9SPHN|nr:phytanoyl-CoA dioxygenase family protein [Croceicoccus mobilis]GGD59719.1 hypothetical protein GCM10010990_06390 [Croceicoccus mobilis]